MSFYSAMPAPNSAMKAGHSAKSQKPADLHRNHLPACSGIGCRHAPEWGAALERIFQKSVFGSLLINLLMEQINHLLQNSVYMYPC
jgi:hypothetical protein